jgi:hypothetical protein
MVHSGMEETTKKKTYESVVSTCVVEGRMIGDSVEERACEV